MRKVDHLQRPEGHIETIRDQSVDRALGDPRKKQLQKKTHSREALRARGSALLGTGSKGTLCLLDERLLLDLAAAGHLELGDEQDVARHLKAGETL